jgi:hypothetical protein
LRQQAEPGTGHVLDAYTMLRPTFGDPKVRVNTPVGSASLEWFGMRIAADNRLSSTFQIELRLH